MVIIMFDENDNHIKKLTKIMKITCSEKEIIESYLKMVDIDIKLFPIGKVSEMKSEFKNDVFDTIFEDENGVIIDLRLDEVKPTFEEMINYTQYWAELYFKFNKDVQPYFIMR